MTILPPNTPLPKDDPLNQGAIVFSVNRKRPTPTPSETSKKDEDSPKVEKPKVEKPKSEEES